MSDAIGIKHVPGDSLSDQTTQTAGMVREEAISLRTAGSSQIWMGRSVVLPHTASGPHHHGHSETCIYVVEGNPTFRYALEGQEYVVVTAPGDYVFVPPYVHHIEENPHDVPAVVVIARSTQEAIVENLEQL